MRIRLILALLLTLLATRAIAAPYPPDLSLRRYLSHTDFIPRAAQGGMSNPPIVFQNQGTPLGVSFTVNCSTGMTCSFVNGAMTLTATGGGGGFPRLDQVLDPTADKTFAMAGNSLKFNYTLQTGGPGSPAPFFVAGTDVNGALVEINSLATIAGGGPDGLQVWARANHTSGSVSEAAALFVNSLAGGNGGTTSQLVGIDLGLSSNTGAIVPTAYGIWLESPFYNGTTTESSGLFIDNQTGTPAAATSYGIQMADQTGGANHLAIKTGLGRVEFGDNTSALSYSTATNCSSAASPATCGSAAAGSVAVPTGITPTLVVNTTAITANSQILFTPDESLGTKLGVTCNSTIAQVAIEPIVTARTAATSFTIQYNTTITTNPICLSYLIIN